MHFWVPIRCMGIDVKVCAAPICEGRYRAAGRAGESGAGEGRKGEAEGRKGEAEGRKGGGRKGPPPICGQLLSTLNIYTCQMNHVSSGKVKIP